MGLAYRPGMQTPASHRSARVGGSRSRRIRVHGPLALLVIAASSLASAPDARAQHLELTGFGGLQWGGSTDLASGGTGSFDWGPSYGGSAYWRVRDDGLFGVIYSRQESRFDASIPQADGSLLYLSTDVIVNLIHAGGELEISPTKRLTPILGLSVGATYIQPTSGGDTNWFFSAALTGGGKYRITEHFGLRAQMRLIVSVLGSDSTVVCVSAGGATCAVSANLDALIMGDLVAGAYVEF